MAGTLANNLNLGSSGSYAIFDTQGYAVKLSGTVSGAAPLIKEGSGTLTLSNGSNSYSGGTSVAAGTLNYSNVNALGTGPVHLAGNATLQAGVGGTLGNKIESWGIATIDTQAYTVFNGMTLSGIIDAVNLNKIGSGILTISNSGNQFGALTISAGTLQVTNIGALDGAAVTDNWRAGVQSSPWRTYVGSPISGSGRLLRPASIAVERFPIPIVIPAARSCRAEP